MYIPSRPLPLPHHSHQKRQAGVEPHSDNLIPNVDNKVALIVGVSLAAAAILALLLGGLIKRLRGRRRRSSSNSEPSPPAETQPRTFSHQQKPSNADTEATLCCEKPVDLAKGDELSGGHVPRPPSILGVSQTISRPPSALSQHTVKTERSSGWESIAQRVDEKAGTSESNRISPAPSLSPLPPSPRTPTSPSSPIRIPSPVSLKDTKRHI